MRLITRADLDGIACGVLISVAEPIDRFMFVEPKMMQDGEVAVEAGDIIANLPYHPNCRLWFDHHVTNRVPEPFEGRFEVAPSAARVVFDFYNQPAFGVYAELIAETDRIDSGTLEMADILRPDRYVLLSFTLTPGNPADEPYWIRLIGLMKERPFGEVMADKEVQRRCRQVVDDFNDYRQVLEKNSRREGNIVITDLRTCDFKGRENRFLVYTLFPDTDVSLKIFRDSRHGGRCGISAGKNIFNKTCRVNLGRLMTAYGGGGHDGAASCRVPDGAVEQSVAGMIRALKQTDLRADPSAS